MTIQDYPVTFEELEPHFDHFEKVCGISGIAGNLRGQIRAGGNPFEGPRSDEFPTPPCRPSTRAVIRKGDRRARLQVLPDAFGE